MKRGPLLLFLAFGCLSLNAETRYAEIVNQMMKGDYESAVALTRQAVDSNADMGAFMLNVRNESFSKEQNSLYQDYLLLLQKNHVFPDSVVEKYLLDYYSFRDNPMEMISLSAKLLISAPDDVALLTCLAQGYLKAGQIDKCIETYRKIHKLDPDNREAVLYLANYYYGRWQNGDSQAFSEARDYLKIAKEQMPTPYVQQMLKTLKEKI